MMCRHTADLNKVKKILNVASFRCNVCSFACARSSLQKSSLSKPNGDFQLDYILFYRLNTNSKYKNDLYSCVREYSA